MFPQSFQLRLNLHINMNVARECSLYQIKVHFRRADSAVLSLALMLYGSTGGYTSFPRCFHHNVACDGAEE